jgi:hypothetical protein
MRRARFASTVAAMLATSLSTLLVPRSVDAVEAWIMAEELVRERWAEYRAARLDDRPGAFAACLAALDAELAAARELASMALAA